jgi:hypothetical protein
MQNVTQVSERWSAVSILGVLQVIESNPSSIALRESTWTYPIVESIHVLGLCSFLGVLLFWDLRLIGLVLPRVPVSRVWARLIPWITAGFTIMLVTGVALFLSDPVRFYGNVFFRLKSAAMLLAGLNALAFHYGVERSLANWETAPVPPRAARFAGAISLVLWALIVVSGRFIAYNWFDPLV